MNRIIDNINNNSKMVFYFIFAISGFSGLIYESIWSHYLKLFLGHAAYAQTLVLIIFMGGMALGAWLVSKNTHRISNLLKTYAGIEIVIGIMGLLFHDVYVATTDFTYDSLIPALNSSTEIEMSKWSLAGLLILPQSILLGATFPLMSAGVIRNDSKNPGKTISLLYFTNSIGAVAGVLVSGFIFVELFGLDGTIKMAASFNLFLAALVLIMCKIHESGKQSEITCKESSRDAKVLIEKTAYSNTAYPKLLPVFLLCAGFTGLASFIYEIGWIRMLSLVLGSSTHAFELMLSAFILGLAIGGFWVKKRIDNLSDPVKFLAYIQLVMGALALSTLFLYNSTFDYMLTAVNALDTTEQGYWAFNWFSHGLTLFIMLPATICAGMTLPVITSVLFSRGHGERAIGLIYSVNTLGAIIGVILAVQILMPLVGLKLLIATGSAVDIVLGLMLLWYVSSVEKIRYIKPFSAIVAVVFVGLVSLVQFDIQKMSSGVYRYGWILSDIEVLYHKDGKTASVDLIKFKNGTLSIKTNGKTDASINVTETTRDEPTMTLLAAVPMDIKPSIEEVAIIGFGSGLSTHVVLANPNIKSVDTIEIEPAMVEAARAFGDRVRNTYDDPRSHIHIEDAKTFFTSHNKKYDLIISEPSNPWVSGVASLFSKEFYSRINRHLTDEGLFVQWIHMYEINKPILASIIKALGDKFTSYNVYFTTDRDMLLVASNASSIPDLSGEVFSWPEMKKELDIVGIYSLDDLALHKLADKSVMAPFFETYSVDLNSDYHPLVDLYATRSRYLSHNVYDFNDLITVPFPLNEVLSGVNTRQTQLKYKTGLGYPASKMASEAVYIFDQYNGQSYKHPDDINGSMSRVVNNIRSVRSIHYQCSENELNSSWVSSFHSLMERTIPYLSPENMMAIFQDVRQAKCYERLSDRSVNLINLYEAVINRDHKKVVAISSRLLGDDDILESEDTNDYIIKVAMLSNIALNNKREARSLWERFSEKDITDDIVFRMLKAHAGVYDTNVTTDNNKKIALK